MTVISSLIRVFSSKQEVKIENIKHGIITVFVNFERCEHLFMNFFIHILVVETLLLTFYDPLKKNPLSVHGMGGKFKLI